MRSRWLMLSGLGLTVLSCSLSAPSPAVEPGDGEKIHLKLLYAGHEGSDREKDFVSFLRQHFDKVDAVELAGFTGKQADGHDVVIIDYDGDGFKSPRPKLSREYSRSTVTVGVLGAFVCGSLNLKSGYL